MRINVYRTQINIETWKWSPGFGISNKDLFTIDKKSGWVGEVDRDQTQTLREVEEA